MRFQYQYPVLSRILFPVDGECPHSGKIREYMRLASVNLGESRQEFIFLIWFVQLQLFCLPRTRPTASIFGPGKLNNSAIRNTVHASIKRVRRTKSKPARTEREPNGTTCYSSGSTTRNLKHSEDTRKEGHESKRAQQKLTSKS